MPAKNGLRNTRKQKPKKKQNESCRPDLRPQSLQMRADSHRRDGFISGKATMT